MGAEYGSNDDFLKDSNIKMRIIAVDKSSSLLERLHELARRAWQLNYTRRKLHSFENDFLPSLEEGSAFAVAVSDKFGEHGIAGYMCVSRDGHLLDFLLSCRVMGMRVESACLTWLHARNLAPHAMEPWD